MPRELSVIAKLRRRVRTSEDFLDQIGTLAGVGGWELDLASGTLRWTAQTCRIHDMPADHEPTLEEAIGYYAPEVRTVLEAAVLRGIEEGEGWDLELPMTTAAGRQIWVRAQGAVEQRKGRASRLIGAFQDITERRRDIVVTTGAFSPSTWRASIPAYRGPASPWTWTSSRR